MARLGRRFVSYIPEQLITYAMGHVDLDTDRIEIQEDAAGAELQRVEVERRGDTVTFGWKDPWSGDDLRMTCTKA